MNTDTQAINQPGGMLRMECGWPTLREWETYELAPDPALRTSMAVQAYVAWLQRDSRQTVEVWDVTDPAMPKLVCAWIGLSDRATYQQMGKFTLGSLERGFRADTGNPGPDANSGAGVIAIRQMQRFTNFVQWQNKTGVYADARVAEIHTLARLILPDPVQPVVPAEPVANAA